MLGYVHDVEDTVSSVIQLGSGLGYAVTCSVAE